MILTILLFTLRPGVTDEQIETLRPPGTLPDPDLSPATRRAAPPALRDAAFTLSERSAV
jgi:hypothetical protein